MTNAAPECSRCGAPQRQGFVLCPFCRSAYSPELLRTAVPCPSCKEPSAWGQSRCVKCSGWIVVQCLFCSHVSPHNQPACLTCGETFRGMSERKAARDAELRRQQDQVAAAQRQQAVQAYGGVAASFLGSLAGAMISGPGQGGVSFDAGPSWFESSGDAGSYDAGSTGDEQAAFGGSNDEGSSDEGSSENGSSDEGSSNEASSYVDDASSAFDDSSSSDDSSW